MDWEQRWKDMDISWRSEAGELDLVKYLEQENPKPGRALVPLCGDSEAVKHLYLAGYEVTGVELVQKAVEVACKTLFPEIPFTNFKTDRINFIVGDFLKEPLTKGYFDLIYDRAALVALDPKLREAYSDKLTQLLAPGGRLIFVGFDYEQPGEPLPPHPIKQSEAKTLFKDLKLINTSRESKADAPKRYMEQGVKEMLVFCHHYIKLTSPD